MKELPSVHELSGRLFDGRPAAGQVYLVLTFISDAVAGTAAGCSPPTQTPRCHILSRWEIPLSDVACEDKERGKVGRGEVLVGEGERQGDGEAS
jgi:hypothetical protein